MKLLQSAITKQNNKIELYGENDQMEDNVLIIGVFHGDEPQGKYLIEKYMASRPREKKDYNPDTIMQSSSKDDLSIAPLLSCGHPLPKGAREYYLHNHNYTYFTKNKAKELRQNSTDAERILWSILKNNQFYGLHFKRQKPIGKYIVDFVCLKEKIIIELDGGQHNEPQNIKYDKNRTKYLNSLGYKVIRIWNNDIFNNLEGVYECIYNSLARFRKESGKRTVNCSLHPLGGGLGRGATENIPSPHWGESQGEGLSLEFYHPIGGKVPEGAERVYYRNNLLFIPCLNPDGLKNKTRTNSNGVDLNRNFPTKNWGEDTSAAGNNPSDYFGGKSAGSEIETQFLLNILNKYKPKVILTIHAPYKVVNYDGPAEEIAGEISDIIGYPVEKSIGYPTPGSFGTYCGIERNIPTVTLELDENIPVENLEQPVFDIFDYLKVL